MTQVRLANGTFMNVVDQPPKVDLSFQQLNVHTHSGMWDDAPSIMTPVNSEYTVNVKDYGAMGDGETDDSFALQEAINSLPPNGGTVQFPNGVYIINETISIDRDGVTLMGDADIFDNSPLLKKHTNGTMFLVTALYFTAIIGLGISHEGNSGRVLAILGGGSLEKCYITNSPSNTSPIVECNGSNFFMRGNYITNNCDGSYTLLLDRTDIGLLINSKYEDNYLGGTGKGVKIRSKVAGYRAEGISISRNTFINTGDEQITVNDVLYCSINDNMLDQCNVNNILLLSGDVGVQQVTISNNYIACAHDTQNGVAIYSSMGVVGVSDVKIIGNSIGYSGYGVVTTSQTSNVIISGNSFTSIAHTDITANESKNVIMSSNSHMASNFCLSLTDGINGGDFVVSECVLFGQVALTKTTPLKFNFNRNIGVKTDGYSVAGIAVNAVGQVLCTVPHGLIGTPNLAKIQVTPSVSSGSFDYYIQDIYNFDATNVYIKIYVQTLSVAGVLQLNVRAEL